MVCLVKLEINGYSFDFPDELYYTKEHTWARVEKEDLVTVGLNDFAVKLVGDIGYIDLPFEEEEIEFMETFGTIETGKAIWKIYSPISGTVVESNKLVLENPKIINESPYEKGWLIKVKPRNLDEDLKKLIHGLEKIKEWIEKEFEKHVKKRTL